MAWGDGSPTRFSVGHRFACPGAELEACGAYSGGGRRRKSAACLRACLVHGNLLGRPQTDVSRPSAGVGAPRRKDASARVDHRACHWQHPKGVRAMRVRQRPSDTSPLRDFQRASHASCAGAVSSRVGGTQPKDEKYKSRRDLIHGSMWSYLLNAVLVTALLVALALRQLVLGALLRIRTREPATIKEILFCVHVLQGDTTGIRIVSSKDRTAPGGRRGNQRATRAKADEEQRRKQALDVIRKNMAHKLRARKKKKSKSYFFW